MAGVQTNTSEPRDPEAGHSMRLEAGTLVGRYQILRHLATGGMAEVYLANRQSDVGIDKLVVLKRVRPHLAEDAEFREMFLHEARVGASLGHSNLTDVVDFGTQQGWSFLALEYVHGYTTRELVVQRGAALPLGVALTVAREVALALDYLHGRADGRGRSLGLVHRDISPSNIMVSFAGEVKLLDLGIARSAHDDDASVSTQIKGKVHYMAPEQVQGQPLDGRSDLFALGVVLYELTTGRRCFRANGELALLNRVAAARYSPPSSIVEGYPEALERLIGRLLARDPDQRPSSARELVHGLEQVGEELRCALSRSALGDFVLATMPFFEYPSAPPRPAMQDETVVEAAPVRSRRGLWMAGLATVVGGSAFALMTSTTPSAATLGRMELHLATPEAPVPTPEPDVVQTPASVVQEAPPQPPVSKVEPRRKPKPRRRRAKPKEPEAAPSPKIYLPPSKQPR